MNSSLRIRCLADGDELENLAGHRPLAVRTAIETRTLVQALFTRTDAAKLAIQLLYNTFEDGAAFAEFMDKHAWCPLEVCDASGQRSAEEYQPIPLRILGLSETIPENAQWLGIYALNDDAKDYTLAAIIRILGGHLEYRLRTVIYTTLADQSGYRIVAAADLMQLPEHLTGKQEFRLARNGHIVEDIEKQRAQTTTRS